MGLLQKIDLRPIEAKTERNATIERVARGTTELNRDFNSDKKVEIPFGAVLPHLKISLKWIIQNMETALCVTVCITALFVTAKNYKQLTQIFNSQGTVKYQGASSNSYIGSYNDT